ncbi:epimerase [bacterium]|nr:NAD-dependent epimerase/dehydratase family protein [Chloroflexi bacterium CFX6]RIL12666.1 MAG: epimerase [bacterium]
MRTLITGGAGFLGVALANRLAAEGHAVYVLDDLTAGDRDRLDPRVLFTRGDVRDVPRLWSLLAGVQVVYHLAARVSVPESILYPVDYNAVNTGGTVSVMSAARDAGVRRVVFTSSGTIYGEQTTQPIVEGAQPRPSNPYAVSKLAAEHYVRAIGDLYRIETVILRIFNAYGPGQAVPPAHPPVIPHFVRQITAGGSVVLHGNPPGGQTRDFVHVDDVVEALCRAGATGGVTGATLNIGSGVETSLADLIAAIERATGREAQVLASPEQSGGVARMCADIRAARTALDWSPSVALADGLAGLAALARGGR